MLAMATWMLNDGSELGTSQVRAFRSPTSPGSSYRDSTGTDFSAFMGPGRCGLSIVGAGLFSFSRAG